MRREECKALLPIMQAWCEGKTIQVWDVDSRIWVSEGRNISFNLSPERYRIKPRPETIFLLRRIKTGYVFGVYPTSTDAKYARARKVTPDAFEIVEFVEKIES